MKGALCGTNRYQLIKELDCSEVDATQRMRPTAFMEIAQEIAYLAASAMGFGYNDLIGARQAWVLSRITFRMIDAPRWRDEVTVTTWHKGTAGPFSLRDFVVSDAAGRQRIVGTSSWVLLNLDSRALVRNEAMAVPVTPDRICHDHAIEELAERIIMPRDCTPELAGEHTVRYSDVDFLGHTNNVRYAVWALDCLDFEELIARPVREVSVNYSQETRPGERVSIYRHREGDTVWFDCKVGDRQAASICIKF